MKRKTTVKKTGACKTTSLLDLRIDDMGDNTRKTFKEVATKKIKDIKEKESPTVDEMIIMGKYSKKLKAILEFEKKLREKEGVKNDWT